LYQYSSQVAQLPATLQLILVILAAMISGIMNSIAGGGTLLTFPALVGLGIAPIVANATSTVALLPASLSSIVGYREDLKGALPWASAFALPSLLGGAGGALLLMHTSPNRFSALVPWLVLGATALFVVQEPIMRAIRMRQNYGPHVPGEANDSDAVLTSSMPSVSLLFYQFLVSVYGGYFGAGVGILMLAALGFMGLTNIHRMNGLKNWGGLCMNAIAALLFAFSRLVSWPVALSMAMGAVIGGYAGSRVARRVGERVVRVGIIVIGLGSGLAMLAAELRR
jgi:uncharacterized membrane protein YfcA